MTFSGMMGKNPFSRRYFSLTGMVLSYYREIDFEISKWGLLGDPTSLQFVRKPAQTPGNKKRVDLAAATHYGGAYGPSGAGACDALGDDGFNGAIYEKLTLVLQWHAGPPRPLLRWYAFDGHLSLADLSTPAAAARCTGAPRHAIDARSGLMRLKGRAGLYVCRNVVGCGYAAGRGGEGRGGEGTSRRRELASPSCRYTPVRCATQTSLGIRCLLPKRARTSERARALATGTPACTMARFAHRGATIRGCDMPRDALERHGRRLPYPGKENEISTRCP